MCYGIVLYLLYSLKQTSIDSKSRNKNIHISIKPEPEIPTYGHEIIDCHDRIYYKI